MLHKEPCSFGNIQNPFQQFLLKSNFLLFTFSVRCVTVVSYVTVFVLPEV